VGLERGPLSLVSTTEELLGRKRSGSCLKNREYGRRDPLYLQKLAITSPASGGRSVGIVRSRTQTMEFVRSFVQFGVVTKLNKCAQQCKRNRNALEHKILGARWQWSNCSHDNLMSKSQVITDRGQQLFQNMINVIIKTKLYPFYNTAGGRESWLLNVHTYTEKSNNEIWYDSQTQFNIMIWNLLTCKFGTQNLNCACNMALNFKFFSLTFIH
jgi:hypothetical protein